MTCIAHGINKKEQFLIFMKHFFNGRVDNTTTIYQLNSNRCLYPHFHLRCLLEKLVLHQPDLLGKYQKDLCEVHRHWKAAFDFPTTLCLPSIFPFLKQDITPSSLPSIARAREHDFIECATISVEISSHHLIIHSPTSPLGIGFMFPAAVIHVLH